MSRSLLLASLALAAAFAPAACAANGDPPPPSTIPGSPGASTAAGLGVPAGNAASPGNGAAPGSAQALFDARDVGILTLEQTATSLLLIGQNRRPRSSFGPSAGWNGAGRATHRWRLIGADGAVLGTGDIVVHKALEAPPHPAKGAAAVSVEPDVFSFVVRVPVPADGETVEIAAVSNPALVARWP